MQDISMAEALRHWEQDYFLQNSQCDCLTLTTRNIMKKLKKFVLNNARVLSNEDLASVEGGLDIDVLDSCTPTTKDMPCVYSIDVDAAGRYTLTIGRCTVKYEQHGCEIVAYAYCV